VVHVVARGGKTTACRRLSDAVLRHLEALGRGDEADGVATTAGRLSNAAEACVWRIDGWYEAGNAAEALVGRTTAVGGCRCVGALSGGSRKRRRG
jgi:hypothetical protein